MDPTKDTLVGRWPELKSQVRKRWSKLTDEDFSRLSGRMDDLITALQRRYGYGKAQAGIEINNWLHDRDRIKEEKLDKSVIH